MVGLDDSAAKTKMPSGITAVIGVGRFNSDQDGASAESSGQGIPPLGVTRSGIPQSSGGLESPDLVRKNIAPGGQFGKFQLHC